jgi:hypothetical protein
VVRRKHSGVVLTIDGTWRCLDCGHVTPVTPICAGAHADGSPRCSRPVCERCAPRCVRCQAPLCPECYARSKEGALCVQCPPPVGGREAYQVRRQAQAASSRAWQSESESAFKSAQEAQRSVDEAMRRADEIERQINEMKERMRRSGAP